MSEEIVRRLRNRRKKDLDFLKESMNNNLLEEADEEVEDKDIDEEEVDNDEEQKSDREEKPMHRSPSMRKKKLDTNKSDNDEEPADDEYVNPEGETDGEEESVGEEDSNEYINPLDNAYAVKHTIGDEVLLAYSNGTNSKLKGEIDGYDKEGFYRIRWSNGLTTNGITDLALSDIISRKHENVCVCGSDEFVNEGKYIVCDNCGRRIRESTDPLTLADKSRPKGKKLIRSEAHTTSTAIKPSIDESIRKAFKSKSVNEDYDEDGYDDDDDEYDEEEYPSNIPPQYYKLYDKLDHQFWTRLPELQEDIEDLGYIVDDINGEYIIIATDEGDEEALQVFLGGTSRTFTLDFSRARVV